jgi:hypothetical protein
LWSEYGDRPAAGVAQKRRTLKAQTQRALQSEQAGRKTAFN